MQIFVIEPRVARALACYADWQPLVLDGYCHDACGCLVSGDGRVEGVVAQCEDRAPIDVYFDLFSGYWEDVIINGATVQVFLSNGKAAEFSEQSRRVEALVASDMVRLIAHPTGANAPINRSGLVMRARSHVRASETDMPVAVRKGFSVADVEVL